MTRELLLVLGGARGGKSDLAQVLAAERGERVLFVATAEPGDAEMARRIQAHRRHRPARWGLLEEPVDVPAALAGLGDRYDVVLLDCLTLWVSNLLLRHGGGPDVESRIVGMVEALLLRYQEGLASWVVVSNEVGLGVVPGTPLGRLFRDALGRANRLVASRADRVYLAVAGLALDLKASGAWPVPRPGPGAAP